MSSAEENLVEGNVVVGDRGSRARTQPKNVPGCVLPSWKSASFYAFLDWIVLHLQSYLMISNSENGEQEMLRHPHERENVTLPGVVIVAK
jgi:hypothetical protein